MVILIPYILQFQHVSSGDESWVEHYLERQSAKHWGGYGTIYVDCLVGNVVSLHNVWVVKASVILVLLVSELLWRDFYNIWQKIYLVFMFY